MHNRSKEYTKGSGKATKKQGSLRRKCRGKEQWLSVTNFQILPSAVSSCASALIAFVYMIHAKKNIRQYRLQHYDCSDLVTVKIFLAFYQVTSTVSCNIVVIDCTTSFANTNSLSTNSVLTKIYFKVSRKVVLGNYNRYSANIKVLQR